MERPAYNNFPKNRNGPCYGGPKPGIPGCVAPDHLQTTGSALSATMTVTESKGLKKGNRIFWRGDATDSGTITETSWDAVTIA
jgi:hypothetical protein